MYNNGSQRSTKPKEEEIRESLNPSDTVHILFPLSREVLDLVEGISKTAEPLPNGLSQCLFEVMQASEVLWKAPFPLHKMAFKCAADIVVKAVRDIDDYTEYTTLQYLEQHIPDCPAPRPLGCVQMSGISQERQRGLHAKGSGNPNFMEPYGIRGEIFNPKVTSQIHFITMEPCSKWSISVWKPRPSISTVNE